jgi:hypothetical protein
VEPFPISPAGSWAGWPYGPHRKLGVVVKNIRLSPARPVPTPPGVAWQRARLHLRRCRGASCVRRPHVRGMASVGRICLVLIFSCR